MKNKEAIARKLAKLYGIEIIEKPNSHEFVKTEQIVFTFEHPNFWDAFGLDRFAFSEHSTQSVARNKICFTAGSQKVGVMPVFETKATTSGNYNYAMAA
jgi:hypothetical protein